MKVLQDIWILKSTGIVIFHRVFDKEIEPELFGMLMSALDSFAKELSQKGLNSFEFDEKRYTIKKVNEYLFIANSSRKHKRKKVAHEMENLAETFFRVYDGDLLEKFEGNITSLERCEKCFKEEIQDSLEQPVKKFWEGIVNR